MITLLASAALAAIIGMVIRAHALTVVKRIITGWVWLYSAAAPKEDRDGRRGEVSSHLHEMTNTLQKAGLAPGEIAIRMLEIWVMGWVDDMAWCAPFVPEVLADRVKRWSDTLRHFRVPKAMVAGIATLGLMNYSLFSSSNDQPLIAGLFTNGAVIAMTILLWKIKHPLARRIFNSWMGATAVVAVAAMVWVTVNFRLYEIVTFKILMLAMMMVLPVIIVVDKSWRNRLFKSRWWLIPVCWAPIVAGAFAGSLLIVHSVWPLLETLGAMILLALGMFMVCGAFGLAASALCWVGVKGSAGGLRLVASGIRRLR